MARRKCNIEVIAMGEHINVEGEVFLIQGSVLEVKLDGRQRGITNAPACLGPGPTYYMIYSESARIARIPRFGLLQTNIMSVDVSRLSVLPQMPMLERMSHRTVRSY